MGDYKVLPNTFPFKAIGAIPKGRPQMLERDDAERAADKIDRDENEKVKARSKGRCEVEVKGKRCKRRAFEIHHQIGGWKRRGKGPSALAKHKTHACSQCHRLITGNVLIHVAGNRYHEG